MLETYLVTERIQDRLNQIQSRLESEQLRQNLGLGNEIGFYIFDYDPKHELLVRSHVRLILEGLAKKPNGLRVREINLFELLVTMLKRWGYWDHALTMQREEGDAAVIEALKGLLSEGAVAQALVDAIEADSPDVVLLTGVGSAFPIIRTHTLLNNLQATMGHTPLVVFYPGEFDGQGLRLFGRIDSSAYYRAFRLVP